MAGVLQIFGLLIAAGGLFNGFLALDQGFAYAFAQASEAILGAVLLFALAAIVEHLTAQTALLKDIRDGKKQAEAPAPEPVHQADAAKAMWAEADDAAKRIGDSGRREPKL